jgi:hypothetical protein
MPKIYLLHRDDDERMVTVDDDRMRRMRMFLWSIDSQDHDLRTSDDDNNATIKDNDDKPSSRNRNRNHNEDESLNLKGEAAYDEQWQQFYQFGCKSLQFAKLAWIHDQYQYTTIK